MNWSKTNELIIKIVAEQLYFLLILFLLIDWLIFLAI